MSAVATTYRSDLDRSVSSSWPLSSGCARAAMADQPVQDPGQVGRSARTGSGVMVSRSWMRSFVRRRGGCCPPLEAEVDAYPPELANARDGRGGRLVVRNGHAQPRQVIPSAGAIEVVAPRINDKRSDPVTGERKRFRPVILPPLVPQKSEKDSAPLHRRPSGA